jgi:hypothetical protein
MFQRKKGLFEELFSRKLTLRCLSVGHDEFGPLTASRTGLA